MARGPITGPIPVEGSQPAVRGNSPVAGRPVAPGTIPPVENTGQSVIKDILDQWGLGGLAGWAWQQIVNGSSLDQVIYDLRQTPEYKARFAGNTARQQAGLPPMSESEYLQYEQSARQLMKYYGLPAGFYDQPDDFNKFIAGDVSISELHDRVQEAVTLAQTDMTTQGEYGRLYGQGPTGAPVSYSVGDLAAYMLDSSRALPLLQRQTQSAQIAGASSRTGFGEIDRMAAEHLAALGVTDTQAAAGFSTLAGLGEVTQKIIGDTGPALSQADQIAAQFDQNAAAQTELSRRQRARVAGIGANRGQYAETQRGG